MKKNILIMLAFVLFLVGCGQKTNEEVLEKETEKVETSENSSSKSEILVYTSNYSLYDFTKNILGEKGQVINITENSGFHGWEPTAKDIADLSKSDLFIYYGEDTEGWVTSLLSDNTLGNNLFSPTKGVEFLSASYDHDHEEEMVEVLDHDHDHGGIDPHIWLSIDNAKIISENITNELSRLFPKHSDYFQENFSTYKGKLEKLDQKYTEKLANKKRDTIIVSHEAYGNLAKDYGFKQLGIEGINAQGEPSLKQINEIITKAKDLDARVIFYEDSISPKISEMISQEIGGELLRLNPLETLSKEEIENNDDYISIMENNLEGIYKALNE